MSLPGDDLDAELVAAEARLRRLDAARAEVADKIESIRRARAARVVSAAVPVAGSNSAMNSAEKVRLFRSLFQGREDVFPRLWENARDGRRGYAPACAVEWVRGVCEKPRVKCGECPHQAFLPVTDVVVERHLRGGHVIGVYPLMPDDTCRFLAIDFDAKEWHHDVLAVRATCFALGLPVSVERSRSGDGAHAWFFFSEPVPAAAARRMGFEVLRRTSAARRDLGLDSFDRFFPNQDTLPKGGFGNLTALPLQRAARRSGNTEFLDEHLNPIADQWSYLSDVRRISRAEVEAFGRAHAPTMGDRAPASDGARDGTSAALGSATWPSNLPATLGARLDIDVRGVSPLVVGALRRLAAFPNPEFFKRQNLRLSTARTPRYISAAEERDGVLSLPRGLVDAVREAASSAGSQIEVEDRRTSGAPLAASFHGTLDARQTAAVDDVARHETGVLVAPPGAGKTVMAAALIARRGCATLILVHRRTLVEQWIARLAAFLGLPSDAVGTLGGKATRPNRLLDVATLQSLVRAKNVVELLAPYGHVVADECHHLPAATFERVISASSARFVLGLTATPRRRDGLHPLMEMQLGPVRHSSTGGRIDAAPAPRLRLIVRETSFRPPAGESKIGIQTMFAAAAVDSRRNDAVLDDVIAAYDEGRTVLVTTERRDHVQLLAEALRRIEPALVLLHGGIAAAERVRAVDRIDRGEARIVVAVGRYLGEGFDAPRLDTLILALPIAWKGTVTQYVGRICRAATDKREIRVHDYVDAAVPVFARMAERRRRALRALGFVSEERSVTAVIEPGRTIEVDDGEDVLRSTR
jgi:superfamily II DNA or RNA helicase